MNINISARHVDLTPALKEYIENKLSKVEKRFENITSVHVVISVEKLQHIAEARIHVSGADIIAHSSNENMYASIDTLSDKLDRQIIKHKEKLKNHKHKPVPADTEI